MNNFNPHSRLASFYRYFYLTSSLPNNLCNYFWGLTLAVILLPFVWIALAINRYHNIIKFDTTQINTWKYDEKGNSTKSGSKPLNEYRVYEWNRHSTSMGLLFTFFSIVIGFIVGAILFKGLGVDLMPKEYVHGGFVCVTILYIIGLISGFSLFILGLLSISLVRLLSSFQKEKTQEEEEAENAKYIAKNEADAKKRLYRRNNPYFIVLAWRYLVALKEKRCPIITWNYDEPVNKK
jgi:hypothetical protein